MSSETPASTWRSAAESVLAARDRALTERSTESVALDEISGRVLATDVSAAADDPPALDDGTAVEIATGAPLPAAANAVVET